MPTVEAGGVSLTYRDPGGDFDIIARIEAEVGHWYQRAAATEISKRIDGAGGTPPDDLLDDLPDDQVTRERAILKRRTTAGLGPAWELVETMNGEPKPDTIPVRAYGATRLIVVEVMAALYPADGSAED